MIDRSGPKISSCPSRSIGCTPSTIVGSKKWPCCRPGRAVGRPPPHDQPGPRPAPARRSAPTLATAAALISGPTSVAASSPSPGAAAPPARPGARRRASATALVHDDPAARRAALAGRPEGRPEDAVDGAGPGRRRPARRSRSCRRAPATGASARAAATSAMRRPVSPLPVKLRTGTSGLSTSASPTSSPEPVTRLTTPAGKPASCKQLHQQHGAMRACR